MRTINRKNLILLSIFICLIYFPVFLHLHSKPLREWDEARNAINAFEMSQTHNYLIRTYNFEPDMWETKPPLLIWLQTACFKLFGIGELAIRFPSAMATFCLLLFIFYFFNRFYKAPLIGILSGLILSTSTGYLFDHCTRTGDHDALLILFEMLMLFHFYLYLQYKANRLLLIFALSVLLCIYTKSIACFLFFPGMLIYTLISKQFLSCIKDKKIWLSILLVLGCAAIYYGIREHYNNGYLFAVWQNEGAPRYFNTSVTYDYNPRDITFYFKYIYQRQFPEWYLLVIPALLINEIASSAVLKKLHRYIFINALIFFIILSNGTTNSSYSLPLIPLLSIIIGLALYNIGCLIFKLSVLNRRQKIILLVLAGIGLFYKPYQKTIEVIMDKADPNMQVQYAYVFRAIEKDHPTLKNIEVFKPLGYNYPLVFYKKYYNTCKHFNISFTDSITAQTKSKVLLLFDSQLQELEEANIRYNILLKEYNCVLARIDNVE